MEERSELPYDDTADALAALSFLERQEEPPPQPVASKQLVSSSQGSMDESPTPSTEGQQYKSTFAPSRQAAERKAKALAQQEANYAATHKPGKPKGGAKGKRKDRGAWAESSEEEEDEDEEDEDDGSDDDERRQQPQVKQPQPVHANDPRASVYPSAQPGAHSSGSLAYDAYGQGQRSRMLPQPPGRGGKQNDALFRFLILISLRNLRPLRKSSARLVCRRSAPSPSRRAKIPNPESAYCRSPICMEHSPGSSATSQKRLSQRYFRPS